MEKIQDLNERLGELHKKHNLAKTESDKSQLSSEIQKIKEQIEENKKVLQKKLSISRRANIELSIMEKNNIDKLYVNVKGEYFTSKNLAELSVKNKKDVKELTRSSIESKIKQA